MTKIIIIGAIAIVVLLLKLFLEFMDVLDAIGVDDSMFDDPEDITNE